MKAPGYGDRRKAMLEDIAILTGGKPIFKDLGIQLDATTDGSKGSSVPTVVDYLGRAKKVKIDAENTTITEGKGDKKADRGPRRADPQGDRRRPTASTTARSCRSGSRSWPAAWPQIKVGGATETEMKERKALYEDSLHATRAAHRRGHRPRRRRRPARTPARCSTSR